MLIGCSLINSWPPMAPGFGWGLIELSGFG
jgi:hypothetical protein